MMAYSEAADLYLVFGRVNIRTWADADNDGNSSSIDARIDWAIEFADAEINSRLSIVYTELPFTSVPALVKNLSAMFAGVNLYGLPRAFAEGEDAVNMVSMIHQRAAETLDKILMGKLPLIGQTRVMDVMEVIGIANEDGDVVS